MPEPRTLKFMESAGLGKWPVPMFEQALTSRHPELSRDGIAHDQACLLKGAIDTVVRKSKRTSKASKTQWMQALKDCMAACNAYKKKINIYGRRVRFFGSACLNRNAVARPCSG